eukprot:COSAG02_NODE_700_length_18341_cov_52.629043_5_plen_69_part_00
MELLWLKLKVTRTTIFQLFHCVIAIVDSVMMRATDLWLLGRVTIMLPPLCFKFVGTSFTPLFVGADQA